MSGLCVHRSYGLSGEGGLEGTSSPLNLATSHMLHRIGQIIKSRMAVNFVVGGVEKSFGVFRGGVNMGGLDDPDTDAFVAAGINVAGIF